jgi:hypothetical protein
MIKVPLGIFSKNFFSEDFAWKTATFDQFGEYSNFLSGKQWGADSAGTNGLWV